jgi:hypothetical protein
MTRVGRFFGAVLVWTVVGAACLVALAVCLPLFLAAGVCLGVHRVVQTLVRRGEMSGADDLDDVLRAEIDGDGEAYATDLLSCGCARGTTTCSCIHCGWTSCWDHRVATHLCERDPVIEAFDTNPRNTPVGEDFAAWEQECAHLARWAKKLGGTR